MNSILRVIILAIILGGALPLSAQFKYRVAMGRAEAGFSFLDLSHLNAVLEDEGYAVLNPSVFAFGLAAHRFHGRFIYGGKLYNYMIAKSQFDFQLASMNYHYLVPYVGALFFKDETEMMVYGTVGGGLGIANLKARDIGEQFHTNHTTSGFLFDAALHLSHKFAEVEGETKGFELGASLGYQFAPESAFVLETFANTETGIPVAPSGLYFRVSLGMMSW